MELNFCLFYPTFLIIPKKDWDLSTSDNFKPVEQNFCGVSQTPRQVVDHMGLYNHFGAGGRFVSRSTDANLDCVDHVVLVREVDEDHDHEDGRGLGDVLLQDRDYVGGEEVGLVSVGQKDLLEGG